MGANGPTSVTWRRSGPDRGSARAKRWSTPPGWAPSPCCSGGRADRGLRRRRRGVLAASGPALGLGPCLRRNAVPLSRDRIISVAVELVDRNGLDALSMRKLGAALGVEAMSLYNHVENKDDVLDGMLDHGHVPDPHPRSRRGLGRPPARPGPRDPARRPRAPGGAPAVRHAPDHHRRGLRSGGGHPRDAGRRRVRHRARGARGGLRVCLRRSATCASTWDAWRLRRAIPAARTSPGWIPSTSGRPEFGQSLAARDWDIEFERCLDLVIESLRALIGDPAGIAGVTPGRPAAGRAVGSARIAAEQGEHRTWLSRPSRTTCSRTGRSRRPLSSRRRPWWPTGRSTWRPRTTTWRSGPARPASCSAGPATSTSPSSGTCPSPSGSWVAPSTSPTTASTATSRPGAATRWPTTGKASRATPAPSPTRSCPTR